MVARVDKLGRLVIPKQVRNRIGLTAGTDVEFVEEADSVRLRPITDQVRLVRKQGILCAEGMTWEGGDTGIAAFIRHSREDRIQKLGGM